MVSVISNAMEKDALKHTRGKHRVTAFSLVFLLVMHTLHSAQNEVAGPILGCKGRVVIEMQMRMCTAFWVHVQKIKGRNST